VKALFFLLAAAWICSQAAAADAPALPTLKPGAAAVDFSLPGVDGKTWSLRDFASSPVLVLVFTCNHCPTAQAYEGRLKQLADDYRSRGVALVAISPNSPAAVRLDELGYTDVGDDLEDMKIRARDARFNFPYLFDGDSEAVSKQYGPTATPHVFIFDAARTLQYVGRIDDSEREDRIQVRDARNAIDALLAGKTPAVRETRVFGCSTKWADKTEANHRWREKVAKEPVALGAADAAALKALRETKSGKVRLINVWATWCGPCVSEFDELIETNLRFRHRDFELVTVAAQDPEDQPQVLKFLQKHAASTRNLIFATAEKYPLIEALDPDWNGALPHTLLVGPDGAILYRATGEIDFLELRRKIVPALNAITPWAGMK